MNSEIIKQNLDKAFKDADNLIARGNIPCAVLGYIDINKNKSIKASGLDCKIVAIAKHESEVKDLTNMGIPSFNLYREAGEGLAREALKVINQ